MSFEQSSAAADTVSPVQGEIRELSLTELTAVSGGFIVLIEAVTPPPTTNGVILSE